MGRVVEGGINDNRNNFINSNRNRFDRFHSFIFSEYIKAEIQSEMAYIQERYAFYRLAKDRWETLRLKVRFDFINWILYEKPLINLTKTEIEHLEIFNENGYERKTRILKKMRLNFRGVQKEAGQAKSEKET